MYQVTRTRLSKRRHIPVHSNNINKVDGLQLGQTSTEHGHPASRALWSRQVKHQNDKSQDRPPFSTIVSEKGDERYYQEYICPSNYYCATV
jgi:hypothetical protein